MKALIVCSEPKDPGHTPEPFERAFDCAWADRFIRHLRADRELCTGCSDRCVHCRDWRITDHSDDIAAIIRCPAHLPELLDDPFLYLPEKLPPHDVLVAIEIHEEILIELPRLAAAAGARVMIVPVEAPDWLSRWAKGKVTQNARRAGLEIAVPKPFCNLATGLGETLDAFIAHFRIGKPVVKMEILDGRIATAKALISAPCGNSHYVAHNLQGHPASSELQYVISKYWHSYPCTASMKPDPELGGDTILHKGGQIHMEGFGGRFSERGSDFKKKGLIFREKGGIMN
ncbi:MAG: DUF166 family protein [bacterium]|nr:DUF166 family protein [bacterium]